MKVIYKPCIKYCTEGKVNIEGFGKKKYLTFSVDKTRVLHAEMRSNFENLNF